MLNEFRLALRGLARNRSWSIAAVASLAIGLAGAIFVLTIADRFLFRPLPYPDSDRLVWISEHLPDEREPLGSASYLNALDWRRRSRTLIELGVSRARLMNVAAAGAAEQVPVMSASTSVLSLLGATPFLGRLYGEAVDARTGPNEVVLSYPFWRAHFGGRRGAIRETMYLDGEPYTVVGVLPRDFAIWNVASAWIPFRPGPTDLHERGTRGDVKVLARLAPGTTLGVARTELDRIERDLATEQPGANRRWSVEIMPLRQALFSDLIPALRIFGAAALVFLLLATVNVTTLTVMRGLRRGREFALRVALGATRKAIYRQLLLEGIALALPAVAVGLILGAVGVGVARRSLPTDAPPLWRGVTLDPRVFALSTVLAIAVAVLLSTATALLLRYGGVGDAASGRTTMRRSALRVQNALVVGEIVPAVVLLLMAGVLGRSLGELQRIDPGFSPRNIVSYSLLLSGERYADATRREALLQQLLDRHAAHPGVRGAAIAGALPLAGDNYRDRVRLAEENDPDGHPAAIVPVHPGYFRLLGIRLEAGRPLAATDRTDQPKVVLISRAMADGLGKGAALGRRIRIGTDTTWRTVVGVVSDVRQLDLSDGRTWTVYEPLAQDLRRRVYVLVRAAGDLTTLGVTLRQDVGALDPLLAPGELRPLAEVVRRSLWGDRFLWAVVAILGTLSAALAAGGVYGVTSYLVAQREREFAIRRAVGAGARQICWLVLKSQGLLALGGGVLGILAVAGSAGLLRHLLYGVSPLDPVATIAVSALIALLVLAAALIPLRRTLRHEPSSLLRDV